MAEDSGEVRNKRVIYRKVVEELKGIRDNPLPEPAEDWDLIWVLSGPEQILTQEGVKRNETRDRLTTGFSLARKITAQRLGKKESEVSVDDIREFGPELYFNSNDQHNAYFRELVEEGVFENKYFFPREKLNIAPEDSGILHTGHQFEKFPSELLEDSRKIVIISSVRHLPRVERYVGENNNPFSSIEQGRLIFYPALPLEFPLKETLREIRVIPKYQEAGILPPEK